MTLYSVCLGCRSCQSIVLLESEGEPCPGHSGSVLLEKDKQVQAWFNSHHEPLVTVEIL